MMKTSVYLESADARRLGWLASVEQRSQADIIRAAIREYVPQSDIAFQIFEGFEDDPHRLDRVPESVLDRYQEELEAEMEGFGGEPRGDDR